jgi:hypothetical protein
MKGAGGVQLALDAPCSLRFGPTPSGGIAACRPEPEHADDDKAGRKKKDARSPAGMHMTDPAESGQDAVAWGLQSE